jgi:predicted RND superfamily exporter protein
MKSFLERRDRWGNGYSLWLIVLLAVAIPPMIWSLRQLHMENDVAGWLPENDPQSRILNWYQQLFPPEERILISWDDCTVTDPRLADLAFRLKGVEKNGVREGGSEYISAVTLPTDLLKRMTSEGIPFETALQRAQGLLIGAGPLCLGLSDEGRGQLDVVRSQIISLAQRELKIAPEFVSRTIPQPSEKYLTIDDEDAWQLNDQIRAWLSTQRTPDLQIFWPRMHLDPAATNRFRESLKSLRIPGPDPSSVIADSWFVEGSMAAVSVSLSEAGEEDNLRVLEEIHAAAVAVGIPSESLHLGGRPVAGTMMNLAVKHASWDKSAPAWNLVRRSPLLLSVLVSVGLSYLMLRSFRLCILVQAVSLTAAISTSALISPTGGSMNMVLIVMPTLLMVISVSGAIHICNYWMNSGISDPVQSVLHAASIAWLPCFLASCTTAIGLASLIVSSLVPVRDFGIYASIGCIISFVCVLYLLPSLMLYWPARPPRPEQVNNQFWQKLGMTLARHKTLACWGNLVLVVTCLYGLNWFHTETKVIRYFPDHSRVVTDYNFLEQNLSGIVSVDTLVRFNTAQQESIPFLDRARKVLEVQEALRQHSEVSGALSLASFIDLEKKDGKSLSVRDRRNARMRENLIGQKIHERLKKGGEASEGVASMLALASGSADWKLKGDELLNVAGDEIWRITCQSSIMSEYDYGQLTRELSDIADRHLAETKAESGKPQHVVTGLIPIFLRTQQALLESLISSFGMAFVLIGIVMIFLLKSVPAALFSMLPNLMPIAVMFGLLGWANIHVDIGTMITASVALGIAVDGTLHLMTWFQQLIREGLTKEQAVAKALQHCGPALWQTSAAIGLGMLALYPVELLLISRFGWIMSGMIFAALWGDVILLPALLAGPLGAILETIEQKKRSRESEDRTEETEVWPLQTIDEDVVEEADTKEARAAFQGPHTAAFPRMSSEFLRPANEL